MVRKISCFRVVRNSLPVPYIIKEPCNMKKVLNRIFSIPHGSQQCFCKNFFLKRAKESYKTIFFHLKMSLKELTINIFKMI